MYWRDYVDTRTCFWKEREPVAKKEHQCIECGKKILVGEKYLYLSFKSEEGFDTAKVCLGCKEDWIELIYIFSENGEEDVNIVYGCFKEALGEAIDLDYLDDAQILLFNKKWLFEPEKGRETDEFLIETDQTDLFEE